jgi:hypothetical protein
MEINKLNLMKKSQPQGQCQDKISKRVTFSKQEKDAELPYHLLPKHTQQAMIINAFSLDEKSSSTFQYVVASVYWISKADSDFSDIQFQIFVHFETDSNFSRYLSAINQQFYKMCSASQMVVMEHKPLHKSNSSTFRFIVRFKQQHKSSTRKSWQRQLFVDDVLIDSWQCQMVNKNEMSNLRQCQSFVNKMIVVLFQVSARA